MIVNVVNKLHTIAEKYKKFICTCEPAETVRHKADREAHLHCIRNDETDCLEQIIIQEHHQPLGQRGPSIA